MAGSASTPDSDGKCVEREGGWGGERKGSRRWECGRGIFSAAAKRSAAAEMVAAGKEKNSSGSNRGWIA